jgi:hypothetical protein
MGGVALEALVHADIAYGMPSSFHRQWSSCALDTGYGFAAYGYVNLLVPPHE